MGLFVRQLLAGRDFAIEDTIAAQMANFVYLVGDTETRKCMVVDPAWDIDGILQAAEREGMELTGVLATHYHPDHVGGHIFGIKIAGLAELLVKCPVKVHASALDVEGIMKVTGLGRLDLVEHEGGDEIEIGGIKVTALHTPGHTPGSQCFLAGGSLISGDTLFTEGCGRVDLPGGNAEQMYYSLTNVLGRLPDQTVLFPGHNYGPSPQSTMGEQKSSNYYMRIGSLEQWMRLMGRS
jgi:hydroxyacylglutathione hydrolase